MSRHSSLIRLFALAALLFAATAQAADPIKILFLGDRGHHQPKARFDQLAPKLSQHGIELTYTEKMDDINADNLNKYAGLMIYANTLEIKPEQEKAMLEYVESGKGLIPLHCASFCFTNSKKYIDLVGAQFQRHGTGTFRTTLAQPDHEIMKGFKGFESFDETYVHTKHNEKDRTVLEYRDERGGKEPWTWVRTQGKGRVFYTAWGHDERTWGHPGFVNLVERGTRWAVGLDPQEAGTYAEKEKAPAGKPKMTAQRTDVKPLEYVPAKVPFYSPGGRGGGGNQPINQMQKALDPEESLKHYVMPEGFDLKLVAAEPQIGKPLTMTWDERGRLWLSETVDYPNELQRSGNGRDRIRICEDTDGDGKIDKSTIFAEKLSIATSMLCFNGGVIVHQAPDTLFLKDTNGDDVADERKVLFSGWGTGDTHAGPSNLQYGLDGWIYSMVGYSGFRGTVNGEQLQFSSGFLRFKPDGSKLEYLRSTNNNSWGVSFSEEGVLFGSTANGNPSEYMPIPNRYYEGVRGWTTTRLNGIAGNPNFEPATKNIRQVDYHNRFTAAAGHALYTARTYPEQYWNRTAFVNEPTGHLVATFEIAPSGAGYSSKVGWNLLASDDEWAAPIVSEVGPDGNVWILDWYNFIVQHNPTPQGFRTGRGGAYEIELRDKTHGRIYRLVYKDGKPSSIKTLKDATPEQLLTALKSDNMFWRKQAQRLLIQRGNTDVVPQLIAMTKDKSVDAVGINGGAIHAVWTLAGLGALEDSASDASKAVAAALDHPSAGVRRAAVKTLKCDARFAPDIAKRVKDSDGQVRLAAFLALADGEAPAKTDVVEALEDNTVLSDRWLLDAVTAAGAKQDFVFLLALAQRGDKVKLQPAALARVAIISENFARRGPDNIGGLIAALPEASPVVSDMVIDGLLKGWPRTKALKLDGPAEEALAKLFAKLSPEGRAKLVSLSDRWQNDSLKKYAGQIAEQFAKTLADSAASDKDRAAAASQLIDFSKTDGAVIDSLLAQFGPRTSPELSKGLIEALAKSENKEAGAKLIAKLGAVTPVARPTAVRVLLGRTDWTTALIDGIEANKLQIADLALDQKQALATHPDKTIAERAKKLLAAGGGLPNADRQKVYDTMVGLTKEKGDANAGKLVFKNQCAKCHTHSGEGAKIGPDLTGMAVHPKHELLIQILDPSRSVEGNFRIYTVVLDDGRVLNGLLASETKTSIELIDSEAKKHPILRENIEEMVASPKSLMPEGFEQQVKGADMANLLEFLTLKGKYVPIPMEKVANVVTTKGMFLSATSDAEKFVLRDWEPKTVEGVPFTLIDPQGDTRANAIMLYGPLGYQAPKMAKQVELPCHTPVKALHFLSGVSGWGHPYSEKGSVTMTVRLKYEDGKTEDHELKNGEQFADYIRRVDVPGSKFAFMARSAQMRYLSVTPKRPDTVETIELIKGPDDTAPVVMAVTIETPQP